MMRVSLGGSLSPSSGVNLSSRRFTRPPSVLRPVIVNAVGTSGDDNEDSNLSPLREQLSRTWSHSPTISGRELRQLIWDKWGRSYDTRLHKRGNRMYVQIMWKHLEQKSFPLTEEEYQMQLDAVADCLTVWGVAPFVRAAIQASTNRGPGYTGGGGARAVSIPIEVDLDGNRASEWKTPR